jgi:DNA-binding CsgD family transcriptional regulator
MTLYNVDKLNKGQRACLRLVLGHLNSKEIGRELGISPHTVDQRLRQSMRIMGVASRFEAARKFAETDANGTYQPLIYQSSDIENSGPSVSLTEPAKQDETPVDGLLAKRSTVDRGSAALTMDRAAMATSRLPIPRYRGDKNKLSIIERFGWIIMIAIGSAVSFGGILAGLEALSRLRG